MFPLWAPDSSINYLCPWGVADADDLMGGVQPMRHWYQPRTAFLEVGPTWRPADFQQEWGKDPLPFFLFLMFLLCCLTQFNGYSEFFFLLTDKSVRKWTRSWISVTVPTLYLKFPFPSENDYFNTWSSFPYEFTPYDIFRSKVRQTAEESSPVPQACLLQICYSQQQWILISVTYITSNNGHFSGIDSFRKMFQFY